MSTYTTLLQSPFDRISPEGDDSIGELFEIARFFRPSSEGLDKFIAACGYVGDLVDVKEKVTSVAHLFPKSMHSKPKWSTNPI